MAEDGEGDIEELLLRTLQVSVPSETTPTGDAPRADVLRHLRENSQRDAHHKKAHSSTHATGVGKWREHIDEEDKSEQPQRVKRRFDLPNDRHTSLDEDIGKRKKQRIEAAAGRILRSIVEDDHEEEKRVLQFELDDEHVDIDCTICIPPFLEALAASEKLSLSSNGPRKIEVNPEISMKRAATRQSEVAEERRRVTRSAPEKDDSLVLTGAVRNRAGKVIENIAEIRKALPIAEFRNELVNAIRDHQVLVVIAETGSGKTTQIAQYLHEEGFSNGGYKIGVTQPRRVAAISVARRVATEMGTKVGGTVGYSVRFDDCYSRYTRIKYMTDGILLREALLDKELAQYSVIVLDEAHERSINTDMLFALLKELCKRRPKLKLIITSATLDSEKICTYFDCPLFSVPGRSYPVKTFFLRLPEVDYVESTIDTALQVHASNEGQSGDILIFLTGQEEIDYVCSRLREKWATMKGTLTQKIIMEIMIQPIYSSMPMEEQSKIFIDTPLGYRKIVVSTNIAETSVTIDGILFVIDCGFVKKKMFDPKIRMEVLQIFPVSKAEAKQRAGRAGRTGPGFCFRMYTETAWLHELPPEAVPEIQRSNLSNVVLTLKAMGIDLQSFDFMEPPKDDALFDALLTLHGLGALTDRGNLTDLGKQLSELPTDPTLGKTLISSHELKCSEEILTIVACLSSGNVFYLPNDRKQLADQKKRQFAHKDGDQLTYLSVFAEWMNTSHQYSWCMENFINQKSMTQALDIRKQLRDMLIKYKMIPSSCKYSHVIRKALASGFFLQAARQTKDGYTTLKGDVFVKIHPSSVLFGRPTQESQEVRGTLNQNASLPPFVIFNELVHTTQEYIRDVVAINPRWLAECAPSHYKIKAA